jgi:hypothetical protein
MNPCVRSASAPFVLAVLAVLSVTRAGAEPVTHQFTGQITSFGGSLNLSSLFSIGDAVAVEYTIERSTTPEPQDAYVTAYTNPLTNVSFTVGTWSGGSAPASSGATVTNNAPSPGQPGVFYDQWYWNASGVSAPPVGGTVHLQTVTSTLDDIEGTVFGSGDIPRVFPALNVFDGKTATFLMIDYGSFQSGYFMATLSGVSTPARGTSWGGIKALYRE